MAKRDFLGGFELLVLLAIVRLGDDAYGVPIADAIEHAIDVQEQDAHARTLPKRGGRSRVSSP